MDAWQLPGINYTEPGEHVNNAALSTMFAMANGLIDAVFVPFETIEPWIKDLIEAPEPLKFLEDNVTELIGYSAGWITCLVVSAIYILGISAFLIIFCSCRCCCGTCGHSNKQSYTEANSCWRWVNCSGLLLLNILLVLGAVFVFMTNNWINEVLESLPEDVTIIIDSFNNYISGTSNQVTYMTTEFNITYTEILTTVVSFGTVFVEPIVNQTLAFLQPTLDDFEQIPEDIGNIESLLTTADNTLAQLVTAQTEFNTNVTDIQNLLKTASCGDDEGCADLMQIGENSELWNFPYQFSSLQGFQELITLLNGILADIPITELVQQLEDGIDDLVSVVDEQTKAITNELDTYIENIDTQVQSALAEVNKGAETLNDFVFKLDEYTDSVSNLEEYITTFNYYRWSIGVGLTSTVLLVVVIYLIAMLFGVFCPGDKRPNRRSTLSHIGHYLLYVGSGLAGFFGCLLMILVVVFFTVGGFGQRYFCEPVQPPEYELIEFTEGIVKNLTGFSLAQSLENTGLVWTPDTVLNEVTLTYVLNSCEDNAAIWQLAKLDYTELSDTVELLPSTISNLTEKINNEIATSLQPAIEQAINSSPINQDLANLEEYTTLLNETVNSVNATLYTDYVKLTISATQTQINKIKYQISQVQTDPNSEASIIQDQAIADLNALDLGPQQYLLDIFEQQLIDVQDTIRQFTNGLVVLEQNVEVTQNYFLYDFADNVTASATDIISGLTNQTLDFTNWLIGATETELGQCENIYQAFSDTDDLLCSEIINTVNGFWFSLGMCVAVLPFTIFFAIKLSKYYKKYSRVSNK